MKFWAIFLSVYIVALAVMPCCVFDNCPYDKSIKAESGQVSHTQGDEDGCGMCSPFFNCSGCSSVFMTTSHSTIHIFTASCTQVLSVHYHSFIPENHPGKIWQPPKLA